MKLPFIGKYETTTPDNVDEMSGGQADAAAESMVNYPETEDLVGKLLCGKCGGYKRDRMIGKASTLPMIGKHCGCPTKHPKEGKMRGEIIEAHESKELIGKQERPPYLRIGLRPRLRTGETLRRLRQQTPSPQPKQKSPVAPRMTGKMHLPLIGKSLSSSTDSRPSLAEMNYSTSELQETGRCEDCAHGHDSFTANTHGFFISGLKCDALHDDPMVAKHGRCDLWTGGELTKASGGWGPIPNGRKGGQRRRKGNGWEYRYDAREDRKQKIHFRSDDIRKLREKIRRKGPNGGREVSLTQAELHLVLKTGKYALVSAGKNPRLEPSMTKDQEQRRHQILRSRLVHEGFAFTQVEGHYGGEEDSFLVMVHDANREHVRALGREFNQDSVIYGEQGQQELHFTTGEHADKNECNAGRGYEIKPEAEDFFTRFPHPDGTQTKFALHLDFDNFVPCKKSMRHTLDLRKARDGGGPQAEYQPQSMPDFQFIYHQPRDRENKKRERQASENRRRSMADKNKGTFGFHGEAPEPQLRAEDSDYVPAMHYGGRRLADEAPKPRVQTERLFARMSGVKPPAGFTRAPKSKKGGYVKVVGGKRIYWYPGQPDPNTKSDVSIREGRTKPKPSGTEPKSDISVEELDGIVQALGKEMGIESTLSVGSATGHAILGRGLTIRVRSKGKAIKDGKAIGKKLAEQWYVTGPHGYTEVRIGNYGGSSGWRDGTSLYLVLRPDVMPGTTAAKVKLRKDAKRKAPTGNAKKGEKFAKEISDALSSKISDVNVTRSSYLIPATEKLVESGDILAIQAARSALNKLWKEARKETSTLVRKPNGPRHNPDHPDRDAYQRAELTEVLLRIDVLPQLDRALQGG